MLYLDTHVVVWLYQNEKNLFSNKAIKLIEKNSENLYISPIVILEMEYLYEIGRIKIHGNKISDYLIKQIGLKICNLSFEKIIQRSITNHWTRDPFDRIITAQATIGKSQLLTKDKNIQNHYKDAIW